MGDTLTISSAFEKILSVTGFTSLTLDSTVMILIALFLIYLAIEKEFEPLLLVPIGFGALLANLPLSHMAVGDEGGLLNYFYMGVK